jgi:hypothetical protein
MNNPHEENRPRVFAVIENYTLHFDCPNPKCEHHNEIGSWYDEEIETMLYGHEYDYQCEKCKCDLEIVIY